MSKLCSRVRSVSSGAANDSVSSGAANDSVSSGAANDSVSSGAAYESALTRKVRAPQGMDNG